MVVCKLTTGYLYHVGRHRVYNCRVPLGQSFPDYYNRILSSDQSFNPSLDADKIVEYSRILKISLKKINEVMEMSEQFLWALQAETAMQENLQPMKSTDLSSPVLPFAWPVSRTQPIDYECSFEYPDAAARVTSD